MGFSVSTSLFFFFFAIAAGDYVFPSTFVAQYSSDGVESGTWALFLDTPNARARYDSGTNTEHQFCLGAEPTTIVSIEDYGGGNGSCRNSTQNIFKEGLGERGLNVQTAILSMLGQSMFSSGFKFTGNVSCGDDVCQNFTSVISKPDCPGTVISWYVDSSGGLVERTQAYYSFTGNSCISQFSTISFSYFEARAPTKAEIEGYLASEEARVCSSSQSTVSIK
jgi:hypothetical protein